MLRYMNGFDETTPDTTVESTGYNTAVGRRPNSRALSMINSSPRVYVTLPAALPELYISQGVALGAANASGIYAAADFFQILNGVTPHLSLRTVAGTTNVTLHRAGVATPVAAALFPITPATWHHLEMRVVLDPVAGLVDVRLDGVVWLTYAGNTVNNSAASTATRLSYVSSTTVTAASPTLVDDLVVVDPTGPAPLNTWPGDLAVETITVNSSKSSTWLGSDGDKVDNHLLVDDPTSAAPSLFDYVSAAAGQGRETYGLEPLPTPAATVLAVQPIYHVQASDSGGTAPSVRPVVTQGAQSVTGPLIAPPIAASTVPGPILTSVPGGGSWTPALLTETTIGLETP